jgi:hypothetical protein
MKALFLIKTEKNVEWQFGTTIVNRAHHCLLLDLAINDSAISGGKAAEHHISGPMSGSQPIGGSFGLKVPATQQVVLSIVALTVIGLPAAMVDWAAHGVGKVGVYLNKLTNRF